MQMVLTAEPIDAHRALQCNMVTKVVPHEQLMDEAQLLAHQILLQLTARGAIGQGAYSRGHRQATRRSAADRGVEFLHLCRPGRGSRIVASVLRQIRRRSRGVAFDRSMSGCYLVSRTRVTSQRRIVATIPAR